MIAISKILFNVALFFNGELRSLRHYYVSKQKKFKHLEPTSIPISIIIPVIAKDLKILPLALKGIRECVQNNISGIYIVAPKDKEIIDFCSRENLIFVPENTIFGYVPKDINIKLGKEQTDRSGWVFQQLLKLSGKIGNSRYFVTIDADHILLHPHVFLSSDEKMVFYRSREHHKAYYRYIAALIGKYPLSAFSYVAHKMIFDKELLIKLHQLIEKKWGDSWDQAIIKTLSNDKGFDLSEFELFGNFVPADRKIFAYWHEKQLPPSQLISYELLKEKYGKDYLSVTFPHYLE